METTNFSTAKQAQTNTEKTSLNFGYYSKILHTPFDTLSQLYEAEKKYIDEQNRKEEAAKAEEAKKAAYEQEKKEAYDRLIKAYKDLDCLIYEQRKALEDLRDTQRKAKEQATDICNKLLAEYKQKYGRYISFYF